MITFDGPVAHTALLHNAVFPETLFLGVFEAATPLVKSHSVIGAF